MKPNQKLTKYYYDSIADDNSVCDSWLAFAETMSEDRWEQYFMHFYFGAIDTDTISKLMSTNEISEPGAKSLAGKLQNEYISWLEARGIIL